ncbi:hypothetical protein GFV16_19140 [Bacillus megaterium]|uniref:hypothetical protein n=1 Tax=Priestia megaterium TaxID=1404 RepID=UPI00129325DD|nr:hypothetical protein [Priestia megaterium]MQR88010.1 hypothetical protein [Priestia megaterium]
MKGKLKLSPTLYYEVLIKREIDNLKEYAKIIEDELYKKSEDDAMYHYDEEIDNGQTRLLYIDKLDDFTKFKVHYPNILRHSLITSIYSLAEERLVDACNRSQELMNISTTLNDYSEIIKDNTGRTHTGIFLAEKYLRDCIYINISSIPKAWKKLEKFNKLRNCIVHKRGKVSEKQKSLLKAVDYLGKDIVNLERGYIVLTNKASFELLDTVDELFKCFYKTLVERTEVTETDKMN